MKLPLRIFYKALDSLRSETEAWQRSELEIDITIVEADMKENLVDAICIKCEYKDKPHKDSPERHHEVILEVFDGSDSEKPRMTHVVKKEIT